MAGARSIVVIEDDDSVRELLRLVLQDAGYSVTALSDGRLALDHLDRASADLVLLDLMMPRLDGWTITRTLQADERLRRIPIIVFSSLGHQAPSGVAEVVHKPAGVTEVLAAVARVLGHDRRRAPRFSLSVALTTRFAGGALPATTRDISEGGLSFTAASAPRVGERMTATMSLPANGVAEVEIEVRHVAAADDGWHVGARFVSFHQNADGFTATLARIAGAQPR